MLAPDRIRSYLDAVGTALDEQRRVPRWSKWSRRAALASGALALTSACGGETSNPNVILTGDGPALPLEQCDNSVDDDEDGLVDCDDDDCDAECPELALPESNCTDGVDNDSDGLADCSDPDCMPDCAISPVYAAPMPTYERTCFDQLDEDADGLTDCDDDDCEYLCNLNPMELGCRDGIDDDDDGLIDDADPDCALLACSLQGIDYGAVFECERCDNGIDDDLDELVDCADPNCTAAPVCPELDCYNEVDDDGDGAVDCDDDDCWPECGAIPIYDAPRDFR